MCANTISESTSLQYILNYKSEFYKNYKIVNFIFDIRCLVQAQHRIISVKSTLQSDNS